MIYLPFLRAILPAVGGGCGPPSDRPASPGAEQGRRCEARTRRPGGRRGVPSPGCVRAVGPRASPLRSSALLPAAQSQR